MKKQELGSRIKQIRNQKGISQEKLALDSKLDRTYINSVENGKRNITIESLSRITTALNISLKDFFDSEYRIETNPEDTVFLVCCDKTNYDNTMINGVDIEDLKSIFSYYDYNKIKEFAVDNIVYIWGTSESNNKIFNLLEDGNIALFANSGEIISYSKLLYKTRNNEFSNEYWPNNKDKIWPCIMIMEKPSSISIPVSTLMSVAGYKKKFIQGLTIPRGEHNILIKKYLDEKK